MQRPLPPQPVGPLAISRILGITFYQNLLSVSHLLGNCPSHPTQGTAGRRDTKGSLPNLFLSGWPRSCRVAGTRGQDHPAPWDSTSGFSLFGSHSHCGAT